MKKNLLFLFLLIYPIALFSQPASGDGSSGSPYSGLISTPWTLSGDQYCGDLSVSSGIFTISAGSTLRFGTGNSLTISGTGYLSAAGNSSNLITFTSSGSSWGHIYFNAPNESNQSVIDYCIIENGDVHTYTDYRGYGGAIHSNYSNLIVSNSTLRNNYAEWGGAIFVNASKNPTIRKCYIYNNQSDRGGGGIYCWNSSSPLIENCIFEANDCLETTKESYSGGGLCAQTGCSIKLLNCTFVNNTTTRSSGASIELYGSTGDVVQNCIFWGSGTHFYRTGTNTVQYCAVQGTAPTGTGNFVLNSSNTGLNPMGPFFNATDGSDWSLKVVSPCTDTGTTPSPAVPTDYTGNSRVRTYDIGAYEVQYNYWKTTASNTDWNTGANWNGGVPTSSQDIVIPTGATNYPSVSTTIDFTIGSGYGMVLEQGAKVTLDDLTNNGILKLNATSAGLASLILNSYTRGTGGNEQIQLFLTGGGTKTPLTYKWHYISPPVTSLEVSTFAPTYTYNIWGWFQDRPTSTLSQAWVAYDGYVSSVEWDYPRAFTTLYAGKGYDYFKSTDYTYTFGGSFNTGDVNASLNYTSGNDNLYGYNLIGNPFSSGLDWDYIITHSFPANTSKGLYFTRNSILCSYINGVGVPGDVTDIIPPMQGFFSKTYSSGNTIVLAAAARTHDDIHATYKGSKGLIPLVRLELTDDTLSDETVVRFDEEAKSYLDNDFDALKMFLDPDLSSIYSSLSGIDYCINGLPFPESFVEVPVTVNIVTDTITKSITATQLQELDDYNVFLIDNSTGFSTDLKTIPEYTFSALKGTITDRFVLKISNVATSIETPAQTEQSFNVYHGLGSVNIQTVSDLWDGKSGSVRLLDMTGKSVNDLRNAVFSKSSLTSIPAPSAKGLYLVEIQSGMMRYVGKVIVK